MRMRWMLSFIVLAGCDTPGPHFKGIDPVTITVEGSTFDVRVKDKLAEAIRTNSQYAPRFGPIAGRAQFAIEQVSGCKVKRLTGDQAVALGQLDCGRGGVASAPSSRIQDIDCYKIDSYLSPATGEVISDYDCNVTYL